MKESLLPLLACPACGNELSLAITRRTGSEIDAGELHCGHCPSAFPIRHGIPRFVELSNDAAQRETAENFGAQWLVFDHVQQHHEQQFRDWIAPVTPEFVRGKVVLEGGCGKGRHTRAIAEWGAQAVVGVDLSEAVEAAYRNTHDLPNTHIIQADIYRLPLKQAFDYAFSVGVLHHLPDPRGGFASLYKHLKPGGAITAWVYGRENNGWIVNFVNPLRERLTSKLPTRLLYWLSYLPSLVLYAVLKLVYLPLGRTPLKRLLFYADYLSYIARFPFREIHNIVHDHLTAPVAFYLSRAEFSEWFAEAQAERVEIHWHNRNSWRGFGYVRAAAPAPQSVRAEASYVG
jgi:SAM-dependent methyltransferase